MKDADKIPMLIAMMEVFRFVIAERVDVAGGCKWLSLGAEKCPCAKCQIDRMDVKELMEAAKKEWQARQRKK